MFVCVCGVCGVGVTALCLSTGTGQAWLTVRCSGKSFLGGGGNVKFLM